MDARRTEAEVNAHYDKVIAPIALNIEAERKQTCNTFVILASLAIIINICIGGLMYLHRLQMVTQQGQMLQIMLLLLVGSGYLVTWPLRSFSKETQSILLKYIMPLFPDFTLDMGRKLDAGIMLRTHMFPAYDAHEGGNYIQGKYRDTAITSVDVLLKKEERTGKNRHTVTVFKGTVYLFSFPKKFSGDIFIADDRGWLGNAFSSFGSNARRVALEDPVFEKLFEVYAEDQVEARYILTTAFMERLLQLADTNGKKVEAAFFDGKLMVKIARDEMRFTVTNPLKAIDWRAEVQRFVDEFQNALAIVDALKLNQNIGL